MKRFIVYLALSCAFADVHSAKLTQENNNEEEEVQDISYEDYQDSMQPNPSEDRDVEGAKPPIPVKPKLPPRQQPINLNPKENIEDYDEGADFDGDDYFGPSFVGIDSSELGNRGNPRWRVNGSRRGGTRPTNRRPNAQGRPNGQRRRNHRRPTGQRRRLNRRRRNSQGHRRAGVNPRSRRG